MKCGRYELYPLGQITLERPQQPGASLHSSAPCQLSSVTVVKKTCVETGVVLKPPCAAFGTLVRNQAQCAGIPSEDAINGQECVHAKIEAGDRWTAERFYSATSSSICSITSSIQTSISSLASSPRRSPFLPFLLSETSSSHWARQVFHSSMRRFL